MGYSIGGYGAGAGASDFADLTGQINGDTQIADASIPVDKIQDVGTANGLATLDGAGLVPSSQLPSYVDDVKEYANLAAFPATGVSGIIYVAIDSGKTYRWTGTVYVEISASSVTGNIAANEIAFGSGTDSISGSANLTYDSGTNVLALESSVNNSGIQVNDTTQVFHADLQSGKLHFNSGNVESVSLDATNISLNLQYDTLGPNIPTINSRDEVGNEGPLNLSISELQLNGDAGIAGQVPVSAGPGQPVTWETPSGLVNDADYGDIVVSGDGLIWTIENNAVTAEKLDTTGVAANSTFLNGAMQWTGIGQTIYGAGAPGAGTGNNGDFYINTSNNYIYGPKAAGVWPAGISLVGPQGVQGEQGLQGIQGIQGVKGDKGDQGDQGIQGIQGIQGVQGDPGADALWNFTGAYNPGASYAVGDVATYLGQTWYRINSNGGNVGDTPAEGLFWTLIAQKGDTGAAGQGVPTGGTAGQVLAKIDADDYNTEWVNQSGGGLPVTNSKYIIAVPGDDLAAKYALAAALTVTATDRASLLIMPGTYALSGLLTLDTSYVDVIGLGAGIKKPSVLITGDTILVTASNIKVSGISVGSQALDCTGVANQYFENCIAGANSFGYNEAAGTYVNCIAGDSSFGYAISAAGTFINCEAGMASFGFESTGYFEKCKSTGIWGFGGGGGGSIASGTYINCESSDQSFGAFATASGTFKNCTATGADSFGSSGNASGYFENCKGANSSFGGSGAGNSVGYASGTFVNCTGDLNSFGDGNGGEITGKLYNCRMTIGAFAPIQQRTVTIALGTPATFTLVSHSFSVGSAVRLTTTGALPTGVEAYKTYYVATAGLTADEFTLVEYPESAGVPPTIDASGTQSGTHSISTGRVINCIDGYNEVITK